MKKFLILFFVLSFVVGCDKEISLVNPEITVSPFEPAPLDTIVSNLIAEVTVDGKAVGIDSYDWKVVDENNQEVSILYTENSEMRWSPKDEGVFFIEATVKAGNKTLTETKQVNVKHNTTSIQRYLAGNWIGTGSAAFIPSNWQSQFSIEENGHYSAFVINASGNYPDNNQVFANGIDTADDPEKRFTISNIDGNGFATGTVKFVHSPGTLLEYGIKDLKFSNDYNNVTFTVFWGAEMTYELERSDGSTIIEEATEPKIITVGVQTDYFSEGGEEQEFYFDTTEAGLYSVAWFDHWFDGYDAAIYVSAYNNDKSTYYFQNEQLIQMNGSPFSIYVPSGERFNFSVKGKGKYGIKITPLEEGSSSLTIGTPLNVLMNLGDTQLLYFEAEANKEYEIVVGNTVDGGAYDDGAETMLSILEEGEDSFSVYKDDIPFPCCGATKTFPIAVETTKKIYVVIDAAYWFKANTVNIVVDIL